MGSIKKLFAVALLGALVASTPASAFVRGGVNGNGLAVGNFVLPIGAGGAITNTDIAPDGTKVMRTDTYGGYIWNATAVCFGVTGCWQQLFTTLSIPTADWTGTDYGAGVYEIRIAYSNTNIGYAYFNGFVYKTTNLKCTDGSNNSCATWTKTTFAQAAANANENTTKAMGPFMAVDPVNPNIAYVGTPTSGLRYTTDGGATWTPISTATIAAGTTGSGALGQGGGNIIAFDSFSSGCTVPVSSVSQCIVVGSYGTGFYRTTNGGQSGGNWALTSGGTGTPTTFQHLIVDIFGQAWVVDNVQTGGGANLHKYAGGTWSKPLTGAGLAAVAVDPLSASAGAATVVTSTGGGTLNTSTNGGSTFAGQQFTVTRTATDVPWLAWTSEQFMTTGNMVYDPSQSHVLYFAEGIGVWKTTSPNSGSSVGWTSQSAGIEQLVSNVIASSPNGGPPNLGFWDRSQYRANNVNAYPSQLAPNTQFSMTWSIDWVAGSPNTFVALNDWAGADYSATSTDGGVTWNIWGTTSTSSVSVGTGTKNFTVATGLTLTASQTVYVYETSASSNFMVGTISSYNSGTGALALTITSSNGSGTLTDWTIHTLPGGGDQGGCIAALDTTHFIMFQGNTGNAYRTTDGGLTWPQITGLTANLASGTPAVPNNSWDNAYYLKRYTCAADRVTAGVAYMYNSLTSPNVVGVYKTTNYGVSWSQVFTGTLGVNDGFNAKMKTVPGNAGHLFFTPGQASAPHPNASEPFKRSTDGGVTWSNVGNFLEVLDFGFGPVASGQTYPEIYVAGYNGTTQASYGIWLSKDNAATWTLLATYPLNTFDSLVAVEGDKSTPGLYYLGFGGSGFQRGQAN